MDFKQLNLDVLPRLESLLTSIFPAGKVIGREFKIGSIRGEAGQSLSINLDTGVWADFATGDTGGDLTFLLAKKLDYSQTDAGLLVKKMLEDPALARTELKFILSGGERQKSSSPIGKPATWTKDSFILNEWGQPSFVYEYFGTDGKLLFVVCRYGIDSEKTYRPWTWDGYRWTAKAFDDGRPLYNLALLNQFPNARVLVVEGEKCADIAKNLLGEWFVPISWAGGAKAVNKSIWAPLAGRHVVIWPDADAPGHKASLDIIEKIKKIAASIHTVNVLELPPASDIADMEESGGDIIMAWVDANLVPVPVEEVSEKLPEGAVWKADLQLTEKGGVRNTNHNLSIIIQNDDYFKGRWWVEEWDGKFNIGKKPADMSDVFDARVYLSKTWGIEVADDSMYKALEATLESKNSIQEWVKSLVWDGNPRFNQLATNVFKLPDSPYVSEVLRLLVCGMVARAVDPGCKFDYCIILRGPQGVGKTLFFEKLGQERYVMLYSRTTQDKDILGAVASGWIVNVEELFDSRVNLRELKSMISSTVDTWRKPYHREMSSQPKRCVLVGTTDAEADFLDDMAGYRRFLIVECGKEKFDLNLFETIRDQLFAEAYQRYLTTPNWYQLSDESVQESKETSSNWEVEDTWKEPINEYLADKDTTTMLDVCTNALFVSPTLQDPRITKRVHRIIMSLGFERVKIRTKETSSGRLRVYQRKELNLANYDPEPTEEAQS